jgi:hypothetical protein
MASEEAARGAVASDHGHLDRSQSTFLRFDEARVVVEIRPDMAGLNDIRPYF